MLASEQRTEAPAPAGPPAQVYEQRGVDAVADVLSSPGLPLPDDVRFSMEVAFGIDLGGVRLHADGAAERSATDVGAHAYTIGDHVVLGRNTHIGDTDHTLMHELAHVAQQRGAPATQKALPVSSPGDTSERAAEAATQRVLSGGRISGLVATGQRQISRQVPSGQDESPISTDEEEIGPTPMTLPELDARKWPTELPPKRALATRRREPAAKARFQPGWVYTDEEFERDMEASENELLLSLEIQKSAEAARARELDPDPFVQGDVMTEVGTSVRVTVRRSQLKPMQDRARSRAWLQGMEGISSAGVVSTAGLVVGGAARVLRGGNSEDAVPSALALGSVGDSLTFGLGATPLQGTAANPGRAPSAFVDQAPPPEPIPGPEPLAGTSSISHPAEAAKPMVEAKPTIETEPRTTPAPVPSQPPSRGPARAPQFLLPEASPVVKQQDVVARREDIVTMATTKLNESYVTVAQAEQVLSTATRRLATAEQVAQRAREIAESASKAAVAAKRTSTTAKDATSLRRQADQEERSLARAADTVTRADRTLFNSLKDLAKKADTGKRARADLKTSRQELDRRIRAAQPRPPRVHAPVQTAKDVLSSETESLAPGRSDLGQWGIDKYGTFSNKLSDRPGDGLAGHEVLQNLWLEVNGFSTRGKGAASRDNPAVALTETEHTDVGRQQKLLELFDRSKLAHMSAEEVIKLNATAMLLAGIPRYVVETIRKEALRHAQTLAP